jgi:hypothetical protein
MDFGIVDYYQGACRETAQRFGGQPRGHASTLSELHRVFPGYLFDLLSR